MAGRSSVELGGKRRVSEVDVFFKVRPVTANQVLDSHDAAPQLQYREHASSSASNEFSYAFRLQRAILAFRGCRLKLSGSLVICRARPKRCVKYPRPIAGRRQFSWLPS